MFEEKKKRLKKYATYLALVFVICLPSCRTIPPPNEDTGCGPVKAETIPDAPKDVSGALIVTDTSGSMNGFAQTSSTRLYTLHDVIERAVRGALTSSEPTPSIKRCWLGEDLDCQSQKSLKEMDNPGTYNAKESRLDKFLAQPKADDKGEDPLAKYRISILVSDGMQARKENTGADSPCLGGADPACMAYLLKQRAEKGYGIWFTLFYLPFNGTHYAERPLDDALWQKIASHATSLNQDPNFQGVTFGVKRTGSGAGFTSYTFQGVKPMIVIALSRDINAGRKFAKDFSDALKRERVPQPDNAVHTIELAPLSVVERRVTKIELPKDAPTEGVRPIEGKRQEGLFNYLIECDRNATTKLNVSFEDKQGEQVVPDGVQVLYNLVPTKTGNKLDEKLTTKPTDKALEIQLTCKGLDTANYDACWNLQAELKENTNNTVFWKTYSSDNMYEAPERLFGLRELIQEVLDLTLKRQRITDRVIFHLERK